MSEQIEKLEAEVAEIQDVAIRLNKLHCPKRISDLMDKWISDKQAAVEALKEWNK